VDTAPLPSPPLIAFPEASVPMSATITRVDEGGTAVDQQRKDLIKSLHEKKMELEVKDGLN
jgi:hypothetical protein